MLNPIYLVLKHSLLIKVYETQKGLIVLLHLASYKHSDVIHVSFWILEINYDRHQQMRLIYVSSLIFTFN